MYTSKITKTHLGADWLPMSNIAISGKPGTGKTNLAMQLAKDLLQRHKLNLTVISYNDVIAWKTFCKEFVGNNKLLLAGVRSGEELLCEVYKQLFINGEGMGNIVIFDCCCVDAPDSDFLRMLRNWNSRSQSTDNYLIITSNVRSICETAGIMLHTMETVESFTRYRHLIKGDPAYHTHYIEQSDLLK